MRVSTLFFLLIFVVNLGYAQTPPPAPAYDNIEYFGKEVGSATAYSDGLVDYAVAYSRVYDPAVPVPIQVGVEELERFEADVQGKGVEIQWEVEFDDKVEYYEIERSYNGTDYEYLSQINAFGEAGWDETYRVLDPLPYTGYNYYRLVQYDFYGNATYSRPIRIQTTDLDNAEVRIFPNPVRSSYLNFQYKSDAYGEAGVHIFDMQGKLWGYKEFAFVPGNNVVQLDIFELPLGAYTLRFQHDNRLYTQKFIRAQ